MKWRSVGLATLLTHLTLIGILLSGAISAFAATAAIIDNGTVQLGVNPAGDLNVPGGTNTPANTGTTVGLRYIPTNGDALSPACLCEGWGVANADSGTVTFSGFAGEALQTGPGAQGLFVVDPGTGVTSSTGQTKAESVGSAYTSIVTAGRATSTGPDRVRVTHDFHPSASANLYEVVVTIQNIGTTSIGDLRYRRVMDWDVPPFVFSEWVEIHVGTATNLRRATTDGFRSANPLAGTPPGTDAPTVGLPPTTLTPGSPDYFAGPTDQGALFDFTLGSLASGAAITFKIYYGAAANRTEALGALSAVGAEVYSFGIPRASSTSTAVSTTGPNIFIFAASGVGGTALPVNTFADLSLTKSATPSPVAAGSNLTYTLTVSNSGPNGATGVVLADPVPANSTFVSATASQGSCATPAVGSTGTVGCTLGSLTANSSATVTIVVNVTAISGSVSNTATVSSSIADPDKTNNSATTTTPVISGSISGRVTQADLVTPIAGATVNASGPQRFASATTLTDGTYAISGLFPGTYQVQAVAAGFATGWFNGKTSTASADPVTVAAGGTTAGVNFALTAGAGGISGLVTRADGVTPIANAPVTVHIPTGGFVVSATTDAFGNYDTGLSLAPGSYKVQVFVEGFANLWFSGALTFNSATPVTVAAGVTTANINFQLSSAVGGITGRVTQAGTATVTPLAGAIVDVLDAATNGFVLLAFTGSDGGYTTGRRLTPGTYKVRARVDGFGTTFFNNKTTFATADPVTVAAGADTPNINIALPVGGGIRGRVTQAGTATVTPLAGAIVDVFDAATRSFIAGSFVTDVNGNYNTTRTLPPGTYDVKARLAGFIDTFYINGVDFTTATPVTVTAGVDTPNIDIALAAGGRISGTIRDRGTLNPIANATVLVFRPSASTFFGTFFGQTDANGFYTITGLRDGDWILRVEAAGHIVSYWSGDLNKPNNPATDSGMATPITILGANTVAGVDINPSPGGGTITGLVTRPDNVTPVPQGTVVQALFGQFARTSFVVQTTTDANGNYTLSGLAPGPYVVQVIGNQGTGIPNSWFPTGSTNPGTALPIDVADGQTVTGKNFSVIAGPLHSISGVVTSTSGGQPINAALVVAVDPVTIFGVRSVVVNGDGSYMINALPPGKYVVRANTPATFVTTHFNGQTVPAAGQIVTLGPTSADPTSINFSLSPTGATIAGVVTSADNGQPIAGVFLNLRNFFDNTIFSTTSQRNGTFEIRGLAPGSYKLRAMEPRFVTRFYTASGNGGLTFDDADFITVVASEMRTGVNIAMATGVGAISGRVVEEVVEGTPPPVVGAVVNVREATSGGSVTFVVTRADGSWVTNGLATSDYKLRFTGLGLATEWFKDHPTRETADEVLLVAPATVTLADEQISGLAGTISGQVLDSSGPVANAGIVIFDPSGGFVTGIGLTDTTGHYVMRSGLAPGTNAYVAQARALGYASSFFAGFESAADAPNLAGAAPLSVVDGTDTGNVNFRLTRTSDISGTISYTGSITGPLHVELFSVADLTNVTNRVYSLVIPAPTFPQAFRFSLPPPDTRGIVPGTYYVRAFIDRTGSGAFDSSDPTGNFGGSTPSAVSVTEGATATASFSLTNPTGLVNARPVADSQTVVTSAGAPVNIVLSGSDVETLEANLTFTVTASPAHGTLSGAGRFLTYTPSTTPPVFTGNDSFTFTVTDRGSPDGCSPISATCVAPLTSTPATVTVAVLPSGFTAFARSTTAIASPPSGGSSSAPQPLGDVEIDENANGAFTPGVRIRLVLPAGLTFASLPTVSTIISNGLQLVLTGEDAAPRVEPDNVTFSFTISQSSTLGPARIVVQNLNVVVAPGFVSPLQNPRAVSVTVSEGEVSTQAQSVATASLGPVLNSISPSRGAQGVQNYTVVLTGGNFQPGATVAFGSGVSVVSTTVNSSTQITATVNIASNASLSPPARDVTVTNPASLGGGTTTLAGAFSVTAPPTVTGTDRQNPNPLRRNVNAQLVKIFGTGFEAPTTSPPNTFVSFSGVGITVDQSSIQVTDSTTILVNANVAIDALLAPRFVTVTNPDGGSATSSAAIVDVADPLPDAPVGLGSPPSKTPTATATAPCISLSPTSGLLGSTVTITAASTAGCGTFSTTATSNSVNFTGVNNLPAGATVSSATSNSLLVVVPPTAADGPVTVAVNGQVSNGVTFTVTSPRLGSVVPNTGVPGASVPVTLSGSKFSTGAQGTPTVQVTSNGAPATGVTVTTVTSVNSTTLTTAFVIAANAPVGLLDVTVTNPTSAGGGTTTLAGGFSITQPSTVNVTLPAFPTLSTYLPSVNGATVTLDATGRCTAKTITPTPVTLQAQFTTNPASFPAQLRFSLTSSAIPGTATNEDCELGATPAPDFSLDAGNPAVQSVLVPGTSGTYVTTLYSWDWGGNVTVTVTNPTTGAFLGSLTLPVDRDNDGLPDAYEDNAVLNANAAGANVLNSLNGDQNGNGVLDRNDRFAPDGLSNFEKYRGVYLKGPLAGASGAMINHTQLGAGMRNLFVRGRGYANDPAIQASPGTCGIDSTTGLPVTDTTLSATNPCPSFPVGSAFAEQGVRVIDVTASFTASTQLPRTSLADPTRTTLDLATVVLDGASCSGGEACDLTSKVGIRNWQFPTLGFSTFGSSSAYGAARVFYRAVKAYFVNRPYQHRTNDPTRVVIASDGTPMLAPITMVGDGNDNGLTDNREATVNGQLAGDTYLSGLFALDLSAMDVNNDGCVELPFVGDPTSLTRCNPAATSATSPQATRQQVIRHVTTHELGHAAGINIHTTDTSDLMYQYSINWTRDGHFSPTAGALLQIHNKGLQ